MIFNMDDPIYKELEDLLYSLGADIMFRTDLKRDTDKYTIAVFFGSDMEKNFRLDGKDFNELISKVYKKLC